MCMYFLFSFFLSIWGCVFRVGWSILLLLPAAADDGLHWLTDYVP